jgi:hypothetical protein
MRSTCDPNEKPLCPRFKLFIFLGNKEGELFCTLCDGSEIKVKLIGRYVRILSILECARAKDLNLPTDVQGFRKAKAIAEIHGKDSGKISLPSTITSYVSKLCKLLETPSAADPAFPHLIERVTNRGARLLHPVEIFYLGQQ